MGNWHTHDRAQQRARREREHDPEFAHSAIRAEFMAWNEEPGRQYVHGAKNIELVVDDIQRQWMSCSGGVPNGLRGFVARYLKDFCGYLDSGDAEDQEELQKLWNTHVAVLDATSRPAHRPPIGRPIQVRLGDNLLAAVDRAAAEAGTTRPMMIRRIVAQYFDLDEEHA